ncbi:MAG TPA: tripartite tricarboxylate transporter substrate binding protein [Xanthobacteraceae bacterium]|nr:tripartite tricarboxylate transporter substrate binding protein [Xanthobacteraceae bacterium]
MKKLHCIGLLGFLLTAAAVLSSAIAYADDFPSRPITFVAVFGPGSASDTVCRIIADPLSAALKQPVVVEDRPGADGAVAAQYVQHANPDGYTLMLATNSPLSADPFLLRHVSYDPVKDFTPVTRVGSFTLMLVVNPSLPVHSVKELIAYAKANPGKLSFASGNTAGIVGGKTFTHWAGLDMLHVPYKSSPPAIEDVIAGRVSMMIVDFTVGMPHVAAGQVRALAVTRLKRSSLFPDLPTLDESGMEGFELDAWAGFVAPAKTPPDVVAKLNGAIGKIIADPEVQKKFHNVGFEGFASTPDQLGDFIKVQAAKWGKMVSDAGIQPE